MKEGKSKWRDYLFTEYHLHSAHNFFPQRTVRDERYKLIQNLLPGQINPGYAFTLNRFFNGLPELIESASPEVQAAYRRMEKPPEFELYDLREDPFEFRNLALQSEHAETLTRLNRELDSWRESTRDPLLDPENLSLLEKEVNACMVDGKPSKQDLHWTYPDYFFKLNQ